MGDAYRKAVAAFAEDNGIEMITFKAGEHKIDVATPYLEKMSRPGVALIGKAQEIQWVTMGTDVRRDPDTGCPHYAFKKVDRRVTVYYFYAMDEEWGPTFLKMAAYFPYPGKLWCNGHEWCKVQLEKKGISYAALANGFAAVDNPEELARLCNRLAEGPPAAWGEGLRRRLHLGSLHEAGRVLPHRGHARGGGAPGLHLLQGLPGEAVPQGREGCST